VIFTFSEISLIGNFLYHFWTFVRIFDELQRLSSTCCENYTIFECEYISNL